VQPAVFRKRSRTLCFVTDRPEKLADIEYHLPSERIAQEPIEPRDAARLLVDRGDSVEHHTIADLPSLLRAGDLVVVNDTKVLPARIPVRRRTGGAAEILLLEERSDGSWEALARPSKKLAPGHVVSVGGLDIAMGEDLGDGRRIVWLDPGDVDLHTRLAEVGLPPLPPYIEKQIEDPGRYQTIFADRPLSAAAPTAGLHFTSQVIEGFVVNEIAVATVELAVGLDTFRPVMVERLDDHVMHTEWYRVPDETVAAIEHAERVVAIGTTVVRALESWKLTGRQSGRSDLFIRRPYDWKIVDVLLTNFHLPQSTLLCLVDAFVGPRWRDLYETAVAEDYRFLSFGDAMLLRRST